MRPMPELKIEEIPVKSLVPYANNAKIHTKKQIDQIAASISEFGNCDPIAVWHNADGEPEIVEGHGRVLALKQLGIDSAPIVTLDHLTDEQRRAYTHVHNQTTLSSDFDYEALVADMDNLNADWEAFGFESYTFKGGFDAIEDLCENEFAQNVITSEGDMFALTLSFPRESKETVSRYVDEFGKSEIVQMIIDKAEKWV